MDNAHSVFESVVDPVAFAATCKMVADPWQERVLRSSAKRALLNCSRQAGKSTAIAFRASHRLIYRSNMLVLCVAPTERQSFLLFDKIDACLASAPYCPARLESNKSTVKLANGSSAVCLPGNDPDKIRGFSAPDMVLVDEAAFVLDGIYAAVRPMLIVSRGDLWLFSTPRGKRGLFYEAWADGGDEWERHTVTAHECPRISAEDLAREKAGMPDWYYRQEYMCEFVESMDSVFTAEQVEAAIVEGDELQL